MVEKKCLACGHFKECLSCDFEIYSVFRGTMQEDFEKRAQAGKDLAKDCLSFYQPSVLPTICNGVKNENPEHQ